LSALLAAERRKRGLPEYAHKPGAPAPAQTISRDALAAPTYPEAAAPKGIPLDQIAAKLGVTRRSVTGHVLSGELPAVRVTYAGKRWRWEVAPADAAAYISARRKEGR
jgi:hypothetical protein